MTRITESGSMGAPSGESLPGLFSEQPGRFLYPPICPPIRPQISASVRQIPLEQPSVSTIVVVCSESRKTDRTWSPGNFGCRGLLVYGCVPLRRQGPRQAPQEPSHERWIEILPVRIRLLDLTELPQTLPFLHLQLAMSSLL